MKRTKLSPERIVFQGNDYTISQLTATLPSGKKQTWEVCDRPGTVAILAFDGRCRLLLSYEYRPQQGRNVWRIPQGRARPGKDFRAEAQRELQEEAGVKALRMREFMRSETAQTLRWEFRIFLATGLTPSRLPGDEDEDITITPVPLRRAFEMAVAGEIQHDLVSLAIIRLYVRSRKAGIRIFLAHA